MRLFRIFIASVIMTFATLAAQAEVRVALVLGNGAYEAVPALPNPTRDARAMADKLRSLGFNVVEGYDLDIFSLQQKVRDFSRAARTADMTLFYYAGHGLGVEGKNYIVPIDARFEDAAALEFETVELDTVLRQMHASNGVSLVFLDACRDNPTMTNAVSRSLSQGTRSVSVGQGLAAVEVPDNGKGTAIAFATSPGDVAYDGEGQHSPFTSALLTHLSKPNTSISEVMAYVTGDVRSATNDRQKPWLRASLTGPVFLNRQAVPSAQIAVPSPETDATTDTSVPDATSNLAAQKALYDIAVASDRVDDYRSYLTVFPNGLFVLNAQKAIERLETERVAALADPVAPTRSVTDDIVEPIGPVVLTVTPAMRAMASNQGTEQLLDMDRLKRREVQARLNLSGFNVGGAGGAFGRNTRSGMSSWQAAQGLVPTGYLNGVQLQLLQSQTEQAWLQWSSANPVRASGSAAATSKPQGGPSAGQIIGTIGGAVILKKLFD